MRSTYRAKIMLAGEYGVILGGSALTIPLHCYQATVRSRKDIQQGMGEAARQSAAYLDKLYKYIAGIPAESFHAKPDLDLFCTGMEQYWMEMNIPTGYGLGSSGAVSAAIYDLFFPGATSLEPEAQREDLALIESYFHGKSSGVDALTIHADQALHFEGSGRINKVDFNPTDIPGGYRFFLLDSGEQSETGPLVKHFLDRMKDEGVARSVRNEYLVFNQKLIESLLGYSNADPALLFRVISDFQYVHFRKMIPGSALDPWIEGQISNEYYLKLNGSGGGYMLGIAHEESMESLSQRWKEKIIWIE